MAAFAHSLVRFAVWNLAGNTPFTPGAGIAETSTKAENQAKGLALLDADFVTLVEVSPISHIQWLADRLKAYGLDYDVTIAQQPDSHLNIGYLHKPGIDVKNPRFVPGSQGKIWSRETGSRPAGHAMQSHRGLDDKFANSTWLQARYDCLDG